MITSLHEREKRACPGIINANTNNSTFDERILQVFVLVFLVRWLTSSTLEKNSPICLHNKEQLSALKRTNNNDIFPPIHILRPPQIQPRQHGRVNRNLRLIFLPLLFSAVAGIFRLRGDFKRGNQRVRHGEIRRKIESLPRARHRDYRRPSVPETKIGE